MQRFTRGGIDDVFEPDLTPFDDETLSDLNERLRGVPEEVQLSVRDFRASAGWSQARLARELALIGMHLDATAITRIESGKRAVRADELWALAAAFRVEITDLLPTLATTRTLEDRLEMVEHHIAHQSQQIDLAQNELEDMKARAAELRAFIAQSGAEEQDGE